MRRIHSQRAVDGLARGFIFLAIDQVLGQEEQSRDVIRVDGQARLRSVAASDGGRLDRRPAQGRSAYRRLPRNRFQPVTNVLAASASSPLSMASCPMARRCRAARDRRLWRDRKNSPARAADPRREAARSCPAPRGWPDRDRHSRPRRLGQPVDLRQHRLGAFLFAVGAKHLMREQT